MGKLIKKILGKKLKNRGIYNKELKKMKIVISESQLKNLSEILSDEKNVYPLTLFDIEYYNGVKTYDYNFITEKDLTISCKLSINENRIGKIDFMSFKGSHFFLIGSTGENNNSIKIFNTIKTILLKHKNEIDELIIYSVPKYILFYKRLINYLGYKYKMKNESTIILKMSDKDENSNK